ncbi:Holliday junction resolvase RuvX [Patescibacteria group bacterium]|nr:MAG: Holliday junction resolvase RuvX [Patescibacteria group bacterium]
MPEVRKILGIDYGTANLGLALADLETRMAFTYTTLRNDNQLVEKISAIIVKENIEKIIIGTPMHENQAGTLAVEKFGGMLTEKTGVSVEYQNEMFTTQSAQRNLIEKGEKRVSKQDDAEAARIILQEWLDKTYSV